MPICFISYWCSLTCTRQGSNLQPYDPMPELDITIGRPSAIHSNNLPSNVRGEIAGEENGQLGDLLRRAKMTLRRPSSQRFKIGFFCSTNCNTISVWT
jgi:hypothetical protein